MHASPSAEYVPFMHGRQSVAPPSPPSFGSAASGQGLHGAPSLLNRPGKQSLHKPEEFVSAPRGHGRLAIERRKPIAGEQKVRGKD